jgi:hypothetical protein
MMLFARRPLRVMGFLECLCVMIRSLHDFLLCLFSDLMFCHSLPPLRLHSLSFTTRFGFHRCYRIVVFCTSSTAVFIPRPLRLFSRHLVFVCPCRCRVYRHHLSLSSLSLLNSPTPFIHALYSNLYLPPSFSALLFRFDTTASIPFDVHSSDACLDPCCSLCRYRRFS